MAEALQRLFAERPDLKSRATELEWAVLEDYLFPRIAERDGCFVNAQMLTGKHADEWFSGKFAKPQIEYVLNHVHIWDVIEFTDVASERAETLRDLTAEAWRWWLPSAAVASLEVWTAGDGEEYGPTVGFGELGTI